LPPQPDPRPDAPAAYEPRSPWQMKRAWETSDELLDALADGWEPFFAAERSQGTIIYLRRPLRPSLAEPLPTQPDPDLRPS